MTSPSTKDKAGREEVFPGTGELVRKRFGLDAAFRAMMVGSGFPVKGLGEVRPPEGFCFVFMQRAPDETVLAMIRKDEYFQAEQGGAAELLSSLRVRDE